MKIVLYGIETVNKGAELMLYAILQEIERKFPKAKVYLPFNASQPDLNYIKTSLHLRNMKFMKLRRWLLNHKIWSVYNRLKMAPPYYILENHFLGKVDYFLDASGYRFCSKWNRSEWENNLYKYQYRKYGYGNSRMIFLPQAIGPLTQDSDIDLVKNAADACSLIMPRDEVSESWLNKIGVDKLKIRRYTDFTALVEGEEPKKYSHLRDAVCLIPNLRMIDRGATTKNAYLKQMSEIIRYVRSLGHNIYLLNHEGAGDEQLAYEIAKEYGAPIDVVTGLNALEVKGLIGTSKLCITSRFHGVASALNSGVPCLASAWSHKYEELYKDYELTDVEILDVSNIEQTKRLISEYLSDKNDKVREHLTKVLPKIKAETQRMWNEVWGD